jgi:phenylacetate-CoA ligase
MIMTNKQDTDQMNVKNTRYASAKANMFEASVFPAATVTLLRLSRMQWNGRDFLLQRQNECLRRIIAYCAKQVPFYKRLFNKHRIQPSSVSSASDLTKIPIMDKNTVLSNLSEICVPSLVPPRGKLVTSSGTSGPPVSFYLDRISINQSVATMLLFDSWASWLPGRKVMHIRRKRRMTLSQRLFWNVFMRARIVNSLEIKNSNARQFANEICDADPSLLVSYPSVLAMIAREAQERPPSLRGIVVGSETATPNYKHDIEKGYGLRVYNRYGCYEFGGALMQDCELHDGLHANTELAVVEVVDSNGEQVSEGEQGRLVITGLQNWVMPLIRYDIEDLAIAGLECACGRGLPTIKNVLGRTSETIAGKDGDRISSFSLLSALISERYFAALAKEFQFVDLGPGKIGLRIVPTEKYLENPPANADRIRKRLQEYLPILDFHIEVRDELPREKSGKQSLVAKQ